MLLIELQIGEDAAQTVSLPRCSQQHISVHNHPSGLTFSYIDLTSLLADEKMLGITAVGNNGNLYAVFKNDNYDGFRFWKALDTASSILDAAVAADNITQYIGIIEALLEEVGQYGIEFICG